MFTIEEIDYLQELLNFAHDDIGHICLAETDEQKEEKKMIIILKEKVGEIHENFNNLIDELEHYQTLFENSSRPSTNHL